MQDWLLYAIQNCIESGIDCEELTSILKFLKLRYKLQSLNNWNNKAIFPIILPHKTVITKGAQRGAYQLSWSTITMM